MNKTKAFTMAGTGQHTSSFGWMAHGHNNSARSALNSLVTSCSLLVTKSAFTMAEILLSLTIIGVVAAITLPSLTGNINERTWNTQRKALYARMSQAIALMPALNGYGRLEEGDPNTVAETFITNGLAKVLKINNICDNEHISDCGFPQKFYDMKGSNPFNSFPKTLQDYNNSFSINFSTDRIYSYSQINTKGVAFETANGESILVYYKPNCTADKTLNSEKYAQSFMCANFIYDLNGNKGPNTVGKDMGFMSALYATDSIVVAPKPLQPTPTQTGNYETAVQYCRGKSENSRLPNLEETMSIFYNKFAIGVGSDSMWSTKPYNSTHNWMVRFQSGTVAPVPHTYERELYCVERN